MSGPWEMFQGGGGEAPAAAPPPQAPAPEAPAATVGPWTKFQPQAPAGKDPGLGDVASFAMKAPGKFAGAVGGALKHTLVDPVVDAAMLPGDVYSGKADLNTPEGFGRAQNMGMLTALGGKSPAGITGHIPAAKAAPKIEAPRLEPAKPAEIEATQPPASPKEGIAEPAKPAVAAPEPEIAGGSGQSVGAASAAMPKIRPVDKASLGGRIREERGAAQRDFDVATADLEHHRYALNQLDDTSKAAFENYMEGRSTNPALRNALPPKIAETADKLRKLHEKEAGKFKSVFKLYDTNIVADYMPHMYKQDAALEAYLGGGRDLQGHEGAGGKQGSGRLLKKRDLPTWEAARAAVLTPLHDNPIDASLASYKMKSNYVAAHEIIQAVEDQGLLKYSQHKPEGWTKIDGMFGERRRGPVTEGAYMPDEMAQLYNRWVSKAWAPTGKVGNIADFIQETTNLAKSAKFGLSAHHAITTLTENAARSMGAAVEQLASGRPVSAAKAVTDALGAGPYMRGRKGLAIYSGKAGKFSPEDRALVDIITQANPALKGHAQDFQYSKGESFMQMARRGTVKKSWQRWVDEFKEAKGKGWVPAAGKAASGAAHSFQKAMELTSKPIFEEIVPQIKMGNIMRDLSNWLADNPHANHEQTLAAARKIVDHADDTFGEMQRENLFMNAKVLQGADQALLSPTYFLGSMRLFGKGLSGIAAKYPLHLAHAMGVAKGIEAKAFSPKDPGYEPAMGYVAGLALSYAAINYVLQLAMTGKAPKDIRDLLAPQTGGTMKVKDKNGVERKVDERLAPFGNIKEIPDIAKASGMLGGGPSLMEYLTPKLQPLLGAAYDLSKNADWRDKPIMGNLDAVGPVGVAGQAAGHVADAVLPISISQLAQRETDPKNEGTKIPLFMALAGYRPAGMQWYNPEGYRAMRDRKWNDEQARERKRERERPR